ncbi:MAG TPA: glycosyltransferase family 4 protein [Thermoanaerobaculia bacterium]|nr:glycosyltransferase family 4 protein [Thermoanaerobaculia bacterium]
MTRPAVIVAAVRSPFLTGGAERHVERLTAELGARGVDAELVTMPLFDRTHADLVKSALAWRMGDFTRFAGRGVDALITTRFPTFVARHPRKVAWVIHQHRPVYDQFATPYSDFETSAEDLEIRRMIRRMDVRGLSESRRVFANSKNVADRLARYSGIASEPLYHPPPLAGRYRDDGPGDYALWVGRLEAWKRPGLAIGALAGAPEARLKVVGEGPEHDALAQYARAIGVDARCDLVGRPSEPELIALFAGARLVVVTAADEDYGYVPLEAYLSGKAVLTVRDAGGPLEWVSDGRTGIVTEPEPEALGAALRMLWPRIPELAAMARAGKAAVERISWDDVIRRLLGAAGL